MATVGKTHPVERLADGLEKATVDDRSYRLIRLQNGMEVLLVHDLNTDRAGASMDVGVGSYSEPDNLHGVAHFLEHLFMGTKKYPDESEYRKYIYSHSGDYNAYTADTHTNYYFEVGTRALKGALDRFAQFFIHPLFLETTLDREREFVDSEYKKNLRSDAWRLAREGSHVSAGSAL
ncbi:hypothetical protein ACJ73_01661 [Blastomyces percursus]|uniref:Peptidase M16 N-terminal domain-containing protein n=1 Tax=Blastomyces percursus TaxID=1658174 RepID=A0A1J9R3H8_9EURO|nr:hypothetical protein ACJ73_01661 [Blastomyces percursus]